MDLTQGDPEEFLNVRRMITSRATGNKSNSVRVENIIEVKQGMCLFEARKKKSRAKKSQNFTLELIAWHGEPLPKALETWSEWLDCKV